MRTPILLLRILGAALAVSAVLLVAGCRKAVNLNSGQPTTAPVVSQNEKAVNYSDKQLAEAKDAVLAYERALQSRKYKAAYEMLSRDSKKFHSFLDFEHQGKQGITSLDLDTAEAVVSDNEIVVELHLSEEPGTAGIHVVQEDGAWKVVYRGGSPSMPYPEDNSGGRQKGEENEGYSE